MVLKLGRIINNIAIGSLGVGGLVCLLFLFLVYFGLFLCCSGQSVELCALESMSVAVVFNQPD